MSDTFDSLGNNQSLIDTFQYTVTDPQGGETVATAIIEVTGTLPVSQVQLSSGSQSVTLNAVVQEVLKGSWDADTLTLSGSAVAGDEFDGGAGSDTLVLGDAGNQIIVENVGRIFRVDLVTTELKLRARELGEPPSPPAVRE